MDSFKKVRHRAEEAFDRIRASSVLKSNSQDQYQQVAYSSEAYTQPQPPPSQEYQWQQQQPQPYFAPPLPTEEIQQQAEYYEPQVYGQNFYSQPRGEVYEQSQPNFAQPENYILSSTQDFQSQPEYYQPQEDGEGFYSPPPNDTANSQSLISSQAVQQDFPPQQPQPGEDEIIPEQESTSFSEREIPQQQQRSQPQPSGFGADSQMQLHCQAIEAARTKDVESFALSTGEDFSICSNCYTSKVAGHEDLASEFVMHESQRSDEIFTCDMGFPRIQQIFFSECVPQNTMQPIRDFIPYYTTLTTCNGSHITSQGPTYTNQELPDFDICPTCFELFIRNTGFEPYFESNTWPYTRGWVCDFGAHSFYKGLLASELQKSSPDFADFASRARSVIGLDDKLAPCCDFKGQDEADLQAEIDEKDDLAQWYQINGYPNVMACPRCYWLSVQLYGAAHLCSPVTRSLSDGIIRQCSWSAFTTPNKATTNAESFDNSTFWRGRRLLNGLVYGYDTGNWDMLISEAESISTLPPACGSHARGFRSTSGRKWYGRICADAADPNDATVVMCEECFTSTVEGLPYEYLFNNDLTAEAYADEGENGFICQPYSNRARSYVRSAAQSGDLASFVSYWNLRGELRLKRDRWLPILAMQNMKMQSYNQNMMLQMMQKQNATTAAFAMLGGANVNEMMTTDNGQRYGNSTIGYDALTQGKADAEMAFYNAQQMQVGGGTGSGSIQETMQLQAYFQIDNQAFIAVE